MRQRILIPAVGLVWLLWPGPVRHYHVLTLALHPRVVSSSTYTFDSGHHGATISIASLEEGEIQDVPAAATLLLCAAGLAALCLGRGAGGALRVRHRASSTLAGLSLGKTHLRGR
jgi:hypothetical protein